MLKFRQNLELTVLESSSNTDLERVLYSVYLLSFNFIFVTFYKPRAGFLRTFLTEMRVFHSTLSQTFNVVVISIFISTKNSQDPRFSTIFCPSLNFIFLLSLLHKIKATFST